MYFKCDFCTELFSRKQYLDNHISQFHKGHDGKPAFIQSLLHTIENNTNLPMTNQNGIIRIVPQSAFGNCVRNIVFYSDDDTNVRFPCDFFEASRKLILETIEQLKNENRVMKLYSTLCVRFVKQSNPEYTDNAFFSTNTINLAHYDLEHVINLILIKIDNYDSRGSNWKLQNTNFFRLYVTTSKVL